MKLLLVGSALLLLVASAQAQSAEQNQYQVNQTKPLAEGHWYSQKIDRVKNIIIIYENWFEQDQGEGKTFKAIIVKQYPLPAGATGTSAPVGIGNASEHGTWHCYAHDYVEGHDKLDPADDSCIQSHYKGTNECKEDAIDLALRACRRRSSNKKTCDIDVARNCLPENQRLKPTASASSN